MEQLFKILDIQKIDVVLIHYFDSLGNEKTIKIGYEVEKDEQ